MNEGALREWFALPEDTKRSIFIETANAMSLPPAAVEKDWWVVRALESVFSSVIGPYTVFKGGTSLSKGWDLIDRFSEDVDLALDRKFLGFDKEMTKSQVAKLRERSFAYISKEYVPILKETFSAAGFTDLEISLADVTSKEQDPLKIAVAYPGITEQSTYLQSKVLIEIGSRSITKDSASLPICSFVDKHFNGRPFADNAVSIPTVQPERTFLEKIFLLHEEFQKPLEKNTIIRMSRHLYDLEKIMDTAFGKAALADGLLYREIVEHRKIMTPLRGISYDNHVPEKIVIIPPSALLPEWEKDYKLMQESMFYADSALPFEKLMERIRELNRRINRIQYG